MENAVRVTIKSVVLMLVACLLAACCNCLRRWHCKPSQPTKGEIFVYVAAPLSGFSGHGGQTVLGGARLAAEQINRAGGLLGYKVTIVGLDDQFRFRRLALAVAKRSRPRSPRPAGAGVIGHYK